MKLAEIITDHGQGPAWEVEYEIYGSNREKPLYTKKRVIYAPTEEAAKKFVYKHLAGSIISIKAKA